MSESGYILKVESTEWMWGWKEKEMSRMDPSFQVFVSPSKESKRVTIALAGDNSGRGELSGKQSGVLFRTF